MKRLYDGDTFEHKGHTFKVRFKHDHDHEAPWDAADGHGVVSEWTTRDKHPGEWILATDRSSHRYYNFAETLKVARRDGWGPSTDVPGETARQKTVRAVTEDFEFLRGWSRDDWSYVGVVVTHMDTDEDGELVETDVSTSLWGVETYRDYHMEVAVELADELMAQVEVDSPAVTLSDN